MQDDSMENPEANSGEETTSKKKTDKTEKSKKASKKVKDELLVKNAIEVNPKLEEAPNKTVVLGWGRMNPITVGHEKLVNKIKSVARSEAATPLIYVSHSQDAKKNPLEYDDKIMLAKKAFGNIIVKSNARTIIQIMQELQKKFSKVILVVGQDRIKQFDELLNKYNGKDYNFDNISIVSAGARDPDSEGVEGMSASKMRAAASQGDFKKFKTGLPRRLQSDAQDVYDMVRGGMKIAEMLELDEALTIQQRRMRAITMRKYKSKIAQGRRRMAKKAASMDKLKLRARKAAIKIIRKKVAGKKGEKYNSLSPSEKMLIDKRVATKKSAIDRIAKKLLPKVRKADLAKLSGKKSVNEEFESFLLNEEFTALFEEPTTGQDPDIKDKKGTQPAVYYKGLAKSTKDKRDAHFKKHGKKDDDDNSAYKPAPGDAEAETKPSKHTKRYHQMFGKEGAVKLDRRFRAFRTRKEEVELAEIAINTDAEKRLKKQHKDERQNLSKEHEREMDGLLTRELRKKITSINKEEFESDKALIDFIEETTNDIFDQVILDEAKGNEGLKKKAEKSGMPLGILRQVYNRGIAAWKTGHRPGTTPQQWGFARVNSFITKQSGTWGKADKDLADKVRGSSKKESVEEGAVSAAQRAAIAISKKAKAGKPGYDSEGKSLKEDDPCWDSHEQRGMKKKNGKLVPNCVPKNEGAEVYVVKKGPYQRKVDGATADRMKKQGWRIVARESVEERSAEDIMFEEHLKSSGADPRLFTERSTQDIIRSKLGSIANKKNYQHALKTLITVLDRKKKESKGKIRHSVEYYAAQISKTYAGVDGRTLADMVPNSYVFEQGGAGDRGTEKVTKRYKKDTPGETVTESVDDLFESYFEEEVTQKQLNDLERFADRLLDKFGIDVEFTKHFADRMNDDRNKPAITIAELQRVFKKIAKNKAKNIRQNPDIEAVLKDIQADLNLPIVINYDSEKDEYEVVNKTIMRKKNFGTSSKVIKV
jgi:nicotinic acid mononucleotide adenylyltransferase